MRARFFIKWLFLAGLTGLVSGAAGGLLFHAVHRAGALFGEYPFLLWLLPAGGLVITGVYRLAGLAEDTGTSGVLQATVSSGKVSPLLAPAMLFSTFLTHLLGGSSGKEGAALQIGSSLAGLLGRAFPLKEGERRLLLMCGMSGAFSGVFGTPGAAAVFALEAARVGFFPLSALFPVCAASLSGFLAGQALGVEPTRFLLASVPELNLFSAASVLALAVLAGLVSILFCLCLHGFGALYRRFFPNPFLRAAAGGVLVILLTLALGTRDYNGAGLDVIAGAMAGSVRPEAFLAKIVLTALTLEAGYKGGEIVPSFFVGACFGCLAGPVLGLPASFGAAVGLASLFCGVTNCPAASLLMALELFEGQGIFFFLLASAASSLASGHHSLYSSQRFCCRKDEAL